MKKLLFILLIAIPGSAIAGDNGTPYDVDGLRPPSTSQPMGCQTTPAHNPNMEGNLTGGLLQGCVIAGADGGILVHSSSAYAPPLPASIKQPYQYAMPASGPYPLAFYNPRPQF